MSSSCPAAPPTPGSALALQTTNLPSGTVLFRFHKNSYAATSFNPNTGKRLGVPEDGARFNPFPGARTPNVPTLYAADRLSGAALESIFHNVAHVPSPKYAKSQLLEWRYSRLKTTRDLVLFELINSRLRQLAVPGRTSSITEDELVHTPASEYPHTRTWAQFLHKHVPGLDGLLWRPRLGGEGHALVLFGDRLKTGDLQIVSPAVSAATGPGFGKVHHIATSASISIVTP